MKALFFVALLALLAALGIGCAGGSKAEEHFIAGAQLQELGRFEEAIAQYDEAIRLNLEQAEAYSNRCLAYWNIREFQRASRDCDEAIRLDPEQVEPYNNRGLVYDDLGQSRRAIEDYNEALRLDPQFARAYVNRCLAYWGISEFQTALKDCDEAIRLDPNWPSLTTIEGLSTMIWASHVGP